MTAHEAKEYGLIDEIILSVRGMWAGSPASVDASEEKAEAAPVAAG